MAADEGDYTVQWLITLAAVDPIDAAKQAFEIMRDPESWATVFDTVDQDGSRTMVDMKDPDNPIARKIPTPDRAKKESRWVK